eukprot:TRINITY_DN7812_c0_g2_i3.p1 TRINITY_DN7812_c0_g2~~TRINITY_DN7812_c0_g2_i3.p1  ORF type:complete len:474 (-),score=69.39 TRINITY_DN7812_c0_g2_i3:84-1367(-)
MPLSDKLPLEPVSTVAPVTSHLPVRPPVALSGEQLWETLRASVEKPWQAEKDRGTGLAYASLVVFDWDDTLLPTASLVAAGRITPALGSPGAAPASGAAMTASMNEWEFDSFLESCADAAVKALQEASKHGRVVIITNSGYGWVNETATRFMPRVLSELENIPVISARSIFEPLGIVEPYRWKVECFLRLAQCFQFDPAGISGPSSLVSIGDGWHERVAAIMAAQDLKLECHVKVIKFLEQPGVDRLADQLDLFSEVFAGLAAHPSWVEACYTYSEDSGLQLEARSADTTALSATFTDVHVDVTRTGAAESPRNVPEISSDKKIDENGDEESPAVLKAKDTIVVVDVAPTEKPALPCKGGRKLIRQAGLRARGKDGKIQSLLRQRRFRLHAVRRTGSTFMRSTKVRKKVCKAQCPKTQAGAKGETPP